VAWGYTELLFEIRVMNPSIWVSHYAGEGRLAVTSPLASCCADNHWNRSGQHDVAAELHAVNNQTLAIVFQPEHSLMGLIYRGLMTSDWAIMIMNSKGKQTVKL
jgi:hypothetical protein